MTTDEARLTRLETKTDMSIKQIKDDVGDIKADMKEIKSSLLPMQELVYKVREHHKDLKEIKPATEANTKFVESLEKSGCPANKVHFSDIEEREKYRRKQNWMMIGTVLTLATILVSTFQTCDKMEKMENHIKTEQAAK